MGRKERRAKERQERKESIRMTPDRIYELKQKTANEAVRRVQEIEKGKEKQRAETALDMLLLFGMTYLHEQEALVHYAPQIYSYVYTDLRGNIRINKNAFEHPDEVIQFLPLILELDEGVEYAVYFGNTLTETFSFIRKQKPQEGYNITVRPVAEAEYINVTLIFKEESRHDEQKPD